VNYGKKRVIKLGARHMVIAIIALIAAATLPGARDRAAAGKA
jgi:hypothetical protein